MPCSSGQESREEIIWPYKQKAQEYEGMLCAVLTAIEGEFGLDKAEDLVLKASQDGKCSIVSFWGQHKASDIERLTKWVDSLTSRESKMIRYVLGLTHTPPDISFAIIYASSQDLNKFSAHELAVIAKILKDNPPLG